VNGADQARIGAGDPGNRCVAHAVQGAARAAGIKSALCERDGFEPVAAEQIDRRDWSDRYGGQLTGQVLVDRDGIVRYKRSEAYVTEKGFNTIPSVDEIVHQLERCRKP
jgi:hypothetical protein